MKSLLAIVAVLLISSCSFPFTRATLPNELTLVKETDNGMFYVWKTDQDIQHMVEILSSEFEDHYERLTDLFQYSPVTKTSIYIFPDKDQFRQYIGRDTEGTYDAEDQVIKVYTPSDLTRSSLRDEYTSQIVHELVHAIIQQLSPDIGSVKWLDEGTAFFASGQLYAAIHSRRYANLKPPDLSTFIDSSLYFEEAGGIAYYFSGLIVQYINEVYGTEKFNQIIRDPFKMEDILERSIEEIYQEWTAYTAQIHRIRGNIQV